MLTDVSIRRSWPVSTTLDPAVDVVVQQHICHAALRGLCSSKSDPSGAGTGDAAHNHPWLLLGNIRFWRSVLVQRVLVVAIGLIIDLGLIGNGRGAARR